LLDNLCTEIGLQDVHAEITAEIPPLD